MNPGLIIAAVGLLALIVYAVASSASRARVEAERKERIRAKYAHDDNLARRLIDQTVWVGEIAEQLRDSLGIPLDIDQKVLKTKKKEIWKYQQIGTNRYALKITLDDDVVVGWDQK
jgi:hypothetical protein